MQTLLNIVWQDVRYAARMARRAPGFTIIAVLSLALGAGANTAVFSLINTLMLRLLPVQDPSRLVELLQHYPGEPRGNGFWSWPSYEYYRDHNHVFSGLIAASSPASLSVRGEGLEPETVIGESASGNFFPVLGVKPAAGRLIGADDIATGRAPAVAVLSWSYWKNKFNLDPKILGKTIVVQNAPVTIVGVTPPEFLGLQVGSRTDIWLPLAPSASARVALLARLRPGVSIEQARAEMTVLYRFTIDERARNSNDPLIRQLRVELEPAGAGLSALRDHFAKPLLVLMAVVALVLLIACTNVAGLMLARGAARQRELAVRVSLGAGRFRLVSQALAECLLLSAMGTLLSVLLAYFTAAGLVRIITSGRQIVGLPQPLEIPLRPDLHVLLFTIAIALLTAGLFALAPAWNALSSEPAAQLREMGGSGDTRLRRRFGSGLVVAQVALSVVLLSAAGLFVRHLWNLQHIDLGFRRDHVLLLTLDPSRSGFDREQLSRAYQELLNRLDQIPGLRSASLSAPTPLSGAGASGFVSAEGFEERPQDRRYVSISTVAPNCFDTLGVPLAAGRDFNFQDNGGRPVAIINRAMAHYYFPSGNPVGKHLTIDGMTGDPVARSYEIVGVVGDAKYYEIREPGERIVYLPAFRDARVYGNNFVLRTKIEPQSVTGDVRRAVREVLKTVPVSRITTLTSQVDASIVPERVIAMLSVLLGALGSILAAIGLYGLLAYTVTYRITEFGIRLALGATGADLLRMVIADALGMLAAGLLIAAPVAVWGRTLAASFIQDAGMSSAVPIAFGAAAMLGLVLLASFVPARRAARVDPMRALRHE
ncbi:MAG TPA: ABC transporter permease [Bryobacteraceae bacterium]|nr:ABC transporter permease [Bryobacteraceae bacterium]